jgi:hypothetical protein
MGAPISRGQEDNLFSTSGPFPLGHVGDTALYLAYTRSPWELPVDAFTIPVGSKLGFSGRLATALRALLGPARDEELRELIKAARGHPPELKPEAPLLIELPGTFQRILKPRYLFVATAFSPDARVTNAATAAAAVVRLASKAEIPRVALNLLGSGTGGLSSVDVIQAMLQAIRDAGPLPGLSELTLTTLSPDVWALRDKLMRTAGHPRPAPSSSSAPAVDVPVQQGGQSGLSQELLLGATPGKRLVAAGFYPDRPEGTDLLQVQEEAQALVSVLASKDVEPPISLGLFGDWGSGKSFFMKKMEDEFEQLMNDKAEGYCSHIVQIHFNAWHYIDTDNLWASLTSEIFEQLADKLSKQEGDKDSQDRTQLLAAAVSSKQLLDEAVRQRDAAKADYESRQEQQRQSPSTSEEKLGASLSSPAFYQDVLRKAVQQTQVKTKLREAASTLRIPVDEATTEDLKELLELRGLGGRLQAMHRSWMSKSLQEKRSSLIITALCLLGPILIGALLPLVISAVREWWSHWAGPIAAVLGLLARAAPLLRRSRQAFSKLEEARKSADELIDHEKARLQQEAQAEKELLARKLAEANSRVEAADQALRRVTEQLEALRADRQMLEFVRQRSASTEYTQHLGVIARAHRDFKQLSELLKQVRDEAHPKSSDPQLPEVKAGLPRVDRIILYIDDLDRCPEDKVVVVLQAVHLLLAFELFVVVVGVDSRWLLHSLQQSSRVFQTAREQQLGMSEEERYHWQSTPLNYLEKIFQIPYALRPMNKVGFSALIDDLTKPMAGSTAAIPEKKDVGASGEVPVAPTPVTEAVPDSTARPGENRSDAVQVSPKPEQLQTGSSTSPRRPRPEPLHISDDEREFMKALLHFIPSPRAAKRFVNTYRLLYANLPQDKREQFVRKELGEFRVALLLLAMLVGYPSETTELLEELIEQAPALPWWSFVDGYLERRLSHRLDGTSVETERWLELMGKLSDPQLRSDLTQARMCEEFVEWAPRVARYSFLARSILSARKQVPGLAKTTQAGPPQGAAEPMPLSMSRPA